MADRATQRFEREGVGLTSWFVGRQSFGQEQVIKPKVKDRFYWAIHKLQDY